MLLSIKTKLVEITINWLETDGRELLPVQRLQDSERTGAPVKFRVLHNRGRI